MAAIMGLDFRRQSSQFYQKRIIIQVSVSSYILDQNTEIANGRIPGVKLNLKFLGIGNGITVRHRIFHPRNIG